MAVVADLTGLSESKGAGLAPQSCGFFLEVSGVRQVRHTFKVQADSSEHMRRFCHCVVRLHHRLIGGPDSLKFQPVLVQLLI